MFCISKHWISIPSSKKTMSYVNILWFQDILSYISEPKNAFILTSRHIWTITLKNMVYWQTWYILSNIDKYKIIKVQFSFLKYKKIWKWTKSQKLFDTMCQKVIPLNETFLLKKHGFGIKQLFDTMCLKVIQIIEIKSSI